MNDERVRAPHGEPGHGSCPLCVIPESSALRSPLFPQLDREDRWGLYEPKLTYDDMWAWHEAIAEVIHERAGDEDPHRFGRESASCDWLADQIIEATGGHRRLAEA